MNYVIVDGELRHYGVKGMKWGVIRASKKLAKATTKEERDAAISSLKKHRSKGAAKVEKLKKKAPKLQENMENMIVKNEIKAAKLNDKAAKARRKEYSLFTSKRKAAKLEFKAKKLEARAASLLASSNNAKAKVLANKTMQEAFNREISNIDQILVDRGKKYLKGA